MRDYGKGRRLLVAVLWAWWLAPFTVGAENPGTPASAARFTELDRAAWREVFDDPCTGDWREHWTLDGRKATVTHSEKGMDFRAGPVRKEDASHAVMWTKQSFTGDIRLDYEYTRLDTGTEAVTILYIQATGSGADSCDKDIAKWADKRAVAAMSKYYKHMHLYHISYAAFRVGGTDPEEDYIRARRYMPETKGGLKNTDLKPDWLRTGLFKTGVPHKITVIKKDDDLFMYVRNSEKKLLCHWKTDSAPPIVEGRIGLRHMWTRGARYRNFRVSVPGAAPMRPMLVATEKEVVRFNERGDIVWQAPSGVARDVWQLANGNVLFPFNQNGSCGVREVAPSGKTVWEFKLPGQYVISCQRMKNGNTLVGASCRGAVLVVSPKGEIVHSIEMRAKDKKHSTTIVRETDSGNILVVEESTSYVTEYALDGRIVWDVKSPFRPFGVERTPSGSTLISGKDGIVEVTPEKKIVWRLTKEDVKAMGPRWFAGFRVLPNGNIMVCNAGGKVPFFEVNRQKQVVWHTTLTKNEIGIAHGFHVWTGKRR